MPKDIKTIPQFQCPTIRASQIAESLLDEAHQLGQGDPERYRYWCMVFMQDMLVKVALYDPSYLEELEEKFHHSDNLPY